MTSRVLIAGALVGLMLCGGAGCKSRPKTPPVATAPNSVDVTRLLDQTKLPDLKGATKPLAEYLGAKGLVMVFVDTTCPFSSTALKDMPGVVKSLGAVGVASVVINNDDAREAAEKFYAATDAGTTVIYDVTADTRRAWDVKSVPTVLYVTADKKLAYHGPAVWKDLTASIEKAQSLGAGSVPVEAEGTGFG